MRTRHKLSKLDLLQYAVEGVQDEFGMNYEQMTDEEIVRNNADRKEIERRIKLVMRHNEILNKPKEQA